MAVDISLISSELAALFLESIFYGIFLILFVIVLIISLSSKSTGIPKKRYIISVGGLMMALGTAHLVCDFLRAMIAFVPKTPSQTPDKFYKVLSHPYAILNWALYGLQTVLGDSVLVWRCYVFCDRKWWTVMPGALLISYNIAALIILSRDDTLAVGSAFIHLTRPWMVSWVSCTTALQILYSLAIVVQVSRKFDGVGRHVNSVLKVIIESCALYTLFAIALLITFEEASDADWVFIDLITQLVGISFCLIIIQLHFRFRVAHSNTAVSVSNWVVGDHFASDTIMDSLPTEKQKDSKNESSLNTASHIESGVGGA